MERWSREGTCHSRINGPRGWLWGEVRGGRHGARKAGTPEAGTGPGRCRPLCGTGRGKEAPRPDARGPPLPPIWCPPPLCSRDLTADG